MDVGGKVGGGKSNEYARISMLSRHPLLRNPKLLYYEESRD